MCSTNQYTMAKVHMVIMGLILIGSINWLTTAFGYNLVEILHTTINNYFSSNIPINNTIYIIVGLCALYIAFKKETWLPFLGKTVLPGTLIPLSTPHNADTIVTVKVKPNSKVVYWAALPKGLNPDVKVAYDDYSNSGAVMSDNNGLAKLPILVGSGYVVPSGRKIERHVHYRISDMEYGMLSKIHTKFY